MQMPGAGAAPMGGMGQIGSQLGSQAAYPWGWGGPIWGGWGWGGPQWSGWGGWGDPWIVAQGPGEQFRGQGPMGGPGQMMRQAMPAMPQQAGQLVSQQTPYLWGWGGPIWGGWGWGGPQWGGWGGWGDPWIIAQGPGEQLGGPARMGGPAQMGGPGQLGGPGQMMRQTAQISPQQLAYPWGWGGPQWGGWGWSGWGGWGDPWIVAQGPGEQFRGQGPMGGSGPMGGFGMMR